MIILLLLLVLIVKVQETFDVSFVFYYNKTQVEFEKNINVKFKQIQPYLVNKEYQIKIMQYNYFDRDNALFFELDEENINSKYEDNEIVISYYISKEINPTNEILQNIIVVSDINKLLLTYWEIFNLN